MTTITRHALLSALRHLMQAAGIAPEELLSAPADAPRPTPPLVANSTAPRAPRIYTPRALSPQAERVIELARRPEGVSVHEVQDALTVHEPTAHRHCQRLADEHGLLTRAKLPGQRQHRYFARAEDAAAYVEAHRAAAAAEVKPAEPTQAQLKAERIRRQAEERAAKAAAQAALKKTPVRRKAPGRPGVELLSRVGTASPRAPEPQPASEPIITAQTKITVDNIKRPTARWQARQEAPDERWPSFASAPLGVNPDTGKAWGRSA